jgi:hypothetical protein
MNFGTKGCMYNCGDSCTGECMKPTDDGMNKEIKKGNLNFDQSGRAYPDNPHIRENWDCIWEKDGKHYKLVGYNYHKEWEEIHIPKEIVEKRTIPYVPPSEREKLYLGHEVVNKQILYSEIEHLIIVWTIDGTKTAGSLTRDIMKLIKSYK